MSSIVKTDQGVVLALDPGQAQKLASRIAEIIAGAVAQPVLLCTPMLRPHIWRLFARVLPHLGVLSHNEVPPQVHVAADPATAWSLASQLATPRHLICITGSFFIAAEMRAAMTTAAM